MNADSLTAAGGPSDGGMWGVGEVGEGGGGEGGWGAGVPRRPGASSAGRGPFVSLLAAFS